MQIFTDSLAVQSLITQAYSGVTITGVFPFTFHSTAVSPVMPIDDRAVYVGFLSVSGGGSAVIAVRGVEQTIVAGSFDAPVFFDEITIGVGVNIQFNGWRVFVDSVSALAPVPVGPQFLSWFSLDAGLVTYNDEGLECTVADYPIAWSNEALLDGEAVFLTAVDFALHYRILLSVDRTPATNSGTINPPGMVDTMLFHSSGLIFYDAGNTMSGLTWVAGSIMRVTYTGGVLVFDRSNDAGASFQNVYSTGAVVGPFYIGVMMFGACVASPIYIE